MSNSLASESSSVSLGGVCRDNRVAVAGSNRLDLGGMCFAPGIRVPLSMVWYVIVVVFKIMRRVLYFS